MWKVWRTKDEEGKRKGAEEFWVEFEIFLVKQEVVLEGRGPFYGGEKVSFPFGWFGLRG
jgi:hypothetical protein